MSRLVLPKRYVKRPAKNVLYQTLEAIEALTGDDQCEVWDMEESEMSGVAKLMQERLSAVYRLAHSSLPHSCYHVHQDWRDEAIARVQAVRPW